MFKFFQVLSLTAMFAVPALGQVQPPIEAYGNLPEIRHAAISDSGRKVAMVLEAEGGTRVAVYDLDGGEPKAVGTGDSQVRGVDFAGDDFVILQTSQATRAEGFFGRVEYSGAFSLNLETMKVRELLKDTKGMWPVQTGLGKIIGHDPAEGEILMPGYWANSDFADPEYHVFRVDLKSGRGRISNRGGNNTRDFVISEDGKLLARVDFSDERNTFRIFTDVGGKNTKIYEQKDVELPPLGVLGVMPDQEALVVMSRGGYEQIRTLSFDGDLSAPILSRDDADIDRIFSDANRIVRGVQYSGAYPSYEFFDEALNRDIAGIVEASPGSTVSLVDWSGDWQNLLLKIEGDTSSGMYIHYDRASKKTLRLGDSRPDIPADAVGQILAFSYAARDGLPIPSIVTLPPTADVATVTNLPLIVMPHGGPESYDNARFDWMAQYFANRGYLVLQPNFRGSSGYGTQFTLAGNGEWGGKMQDDVTDGVKTLIAEGLADPDRVCIVGASYGGYSALAGGAFTPELYKCVVAIAPVSDLAMMISESREDYGRSSWVTSYWEERMADGDARNKKLNAISPAKFAANLQSPVLIIHGEDDTVVPMRQSVTMRNALRRADKPVELIRLEGEDHWLSESETRRTTLEAMDRFVKQHIGQ
ncbi:MAG: S9 family peptidase [Henriciella sp.]|nr:S9 family peptidase [Henriciella sp.]